MSQVEGNYKNLLLLAHQHVPCMDCSISSAACQETCWPGQCSHELDSLHHAPFYSGTFLLRGQFPSYVLSFYIYICRKPEEGDLTFKDPCCARNIHSLFVKHENPREFEFSFQEQLNNNLLHFSKYKRPFPSHLADIYLGSFLESVTMIHGKCQTGVCRTGAVKGQDIVF